MEPLHETTTVMTFEEYWKWNRTFQIKVNKIFIHMSLLLVSVCLLAFLRHNPLYLVLLVMVPALLWLNLSYRVKKTYESNKTLQGEETHLCFYDTYLQTESAIGTAKIEYDKIYKVIETGTNLYIMLSRNQGIVIIKENCTAELIEFIRSHF